MISRLFTRGYSLLLAGVLVMSLTHPAVVMAETAAEFKLTGISGYGVGISGDYAIAGDKIFKREEETWNQVTLTWEDTDSLTGDSVSIYGDYAIADGYVFKREGETWNQQATLTWEDRYSPLGEMISIYGDYAIADGYVFKREGETWNQQADLGIGGSVAISDNYAIVGDASDNENGEEAGAAYIFKREGDSWNRQIKLVPEDVIAYDMFGISVSIHGDYAIVGTFGIFSCGSAYIFKRDGETWNQQSRLFFRGGLGSMTPVSSVAIYGDYAIVGTPSGGGAAYIFKRNGGTWTQLNKLVPGDTSEEYFGINVSVSDNYAIIGTDSGSAYIHPISELGETLTQEVSGDTPVYFDFSDDMGTGQSTVVIIPSQGSGNISVTQYAEALENLPEDVRPIGPVYDIDDSDYTSESGTYMAFGWPTPIPADVDGALLVSTDGENWIDAATDPDISDIRWNLDSPPYSVSFFTTHFSQWAIVTRDPVANLSTALELAGKENDGSSDFIRNDLNKDGVVDLYDLLAIIDLNPDALDTDIKKDSVRDISAALRLMRTEDDGTPEFMRSDANGDGVINLYDLLEIIDLGNPKMQVR